MRSNQVFSYTKAFGDPLAFNFLSRLAAAYRRYVERLSVKYVAVLLRIARSEIEAGIRRNLGCELSVVLRTERTYLRTDYPAPLFCVEVKTGTDVSWQFTVERRAFRSR
jgi:hypothetical protein